MQPPAGYDYALFTTMRTMRLAGVFPHDPAPDKPRMEQAKSAGPDSTKVAHSKRWKSREAVRETDA